jgi:pilus assembly protein CpaB
MSRKTRVILACAFGALAVLVCVIYADQVRDEADRARTEALERYGGDVVSLVVSTRGIEAGEVITSTDVDARDWLSSLAPSHALMELGSVIGREVTVPIAEGAPLTELNFRDVSELADIPSGHVAVSVPITEKLGISQAIRVGAHVTAYRTIEDRAEEICADAIVLAVPSSTGTVASRGTLTIAVPSGNVSQVLTSSTTGDLRLVVPADDVKKADKGERRDTRNVPPADGQAKDKGGE